jgi:hypothetical protein
MLREINPNGKIAENAYIRPFEVKSGRKVVGRSSLVRLVGVFGIAVTHGA